MLLKRMLQVTLVVGLILFFKIASETIEMGHFQPFFHPINAIGSGKNDGIPLTGQAEPREMVFSLPKPRGVLLAKRPCSCVDPCVTDLGLSDWFNQRYNPQQRLILNTTDKIPDAIFTWWLRLQLPRDKVPLEEVMKQMFRIISPPTVDFKPFPSRCRRCAVVGNSGNLLQSRYGEEIDSHDVVIRMNKAVTRGFEEDVGNRTTHHFLYPESALDLEQGVSLVLLPYKVRDLRWMTSAVSFGNITMTYKRVKARVKADKDKILVVNPVFIWYVHDHWNQRRGLYPSTGMLTLIFALHMCDQVSVFGYGSNHYGGWHHYFEDLSNGGKIKVTAGSKTHHPGDFEFQVIQQLANEGKISLNL